MNPHSDDDLLLSRLTKRERASAVDDEDFASTLVDKEARSVVTYGWSSQIPGGTGASWVSQWRGLYFVAGSDYPHEGPFDSMKGAFSAEAFQELSAGLEFTHRSRSLKRADLLDLIARSFVGEDGDTICVNGATYVYRKGSFTKPRKTRLVT